METVLFNIINEVIDNATIARLVSNKILDIRQHLDDFFFQNIELEISLFRHLLSIGTSIFRYYHILCYTQW